MPLQRVRLALATASLLTLSLTSAGGAQGADPTPRNGHDEVTGAAASSGVDRRALVPSWRESGRVMGYDGHSYASAPAVVNGKRGNLFLGLEFDYACAYGSELFAKGVKRLSRLAHVIERSGRRVVFTVAPAKSAVVPHDVRNHRLPQGDCTKAGMRAQKLVLDDFPDPAYLPLRKRLMSHGGQTYWKTDPHWTSVGGAVYAKALAARLNPSLGRRQSYDTTESSMVGLLTSLLGGDVVETAPAAVPRGDVTVQTQPGSLDWVGFPYLIYEHSWRSTPAAETWRGQTLLIGDSFSEFALTPLRPIFHSGRFMWSGHVDPAEMVSAIVDARTVAIEVYQLSVPSSPLGQNAFIRHVRSALRAS